MAPCETLEDYYSILEITQSADLATIKSSYRRLAKSRHPDKNPANSQATAEFQLLLEAYSILCDPDARRSYDFRYPLIQRRRQTSYTPAAPRPSPQRPNSANKMVDNEKTLQQLLSKKAFTERERFNENRELHKVRGELKILREEIAQAESERAAKASMWTYMASFVTAKAQETKEEKLKWERRQLDRKAAQSIKEKRLETQESKVQKSEASIQLINQEIRKVRAAIEREKNQEQEARQREERTRAAKAAEEWRRAEEERLRQILEEVERARREEEAKRRREEEAKIAEQDRIRRESESWRANRQAHNVTTPRTHAETKTNSSSSHSTMCTHQGFWPQIQGVHRCSRCSVPTRRFAFECPGCKKVACASCRRALKGNPPQSAWP